MNKRNWMIISGTLALALLSGRALFLYVMEIISVLNGIVIFLILLFGLKNVYKRVLLYLLALMILWLSCISFSPFDIEKDISLESLDKISRRLIESTDKYYCDEIDIRSLPERAAKITDMNVSHIRYSSFPDLMDRMNLSGIFLPFTGEAFVNPNEKAFLLPYVFMHELSHRMGILNEAQANLNAYALCMNSEDREFMYSANLYALKYTLNEIKGRDQKMHDFLLSFVPDRVLNDLNQMAGNAKSAPGPFGNYSDFVYGLIYVIP